MARRPLPEPKDNRTLLLKIALEMDLPMGQIAEMTAPMRGKTDEEKEQIAEEIITRLLRDSGEEPVK